jgi:outer membrane protein
MENFSRLSVALAGAAFLFLSVSAQAAPALPAPKILVLDKNAILAGSKVGADILRQLKAYRAQGENDLKAQAASLRDQIKAFQQKAAILSGPMRDQQAHALEAKQEALQSLATKKDGLLQGGLLKARQQVSDALGPILKQIMMERGANMILDKAAVIDTTISVDVTQDAINLLNQKMSTLKVDLVAPPPGMIPQQ